MAFERNGGARERGEKRRPVIFKGWKYFIFYLWDAFSQWSPAVAAGLAAVALGLQRRGLGASFSQLERNQDRGCLLATVSELLVT